MEIDDDRDSTIILLLYKASRGWCKPGKAEKLEHHPRVPDRIPKRKGSRLRRVIHVTNGKEDRAILNRLSIRVVPRESNLLVPFLG